MALHAYRDLLRSARIAFRGTLSPKPIAVFRTLASITSSPGYRRLTCLAGDSRLLSGTISQARAGYESNRQLPPSSDEAAAAVKHASDVAKLLRENVVQGEKMDGEGQERYRELFSAAG